MHVCFYFLGAKTLGEGGVVPPVPPPATAPRRVALHGQMAKTSGHEPQVVAITRFLFYKQYLPVHSYM